MNPEVVADCKKGDLQLIGALQPLGALVAVCIDSARVEYCSANIGEWLGRTPQQLLGRPAAEVLGAAWPQLERLAQGVGANRIGQVELIVPVTAVGHQRGRHYVLEFEPAAIAAPDWWDEAARIDFITRLSRVHTPKEIAGVLTSTIAACTGYDRVMVYRFLEDWDGEVIDQCCKPGVEGFLGLRFPAHDIPENARRLYTLNWQRIIADTETDNVELYAAPDIDEPLDLTFSMLRAVHPVHIQYLRNMGIRGSFSVSLLVEGELWGLVTCHDYAGKVLNSIERLAFEEMARLACLHLTNICRLAMESLRSVLRERLAVMSRALDPTADQPKQLLVGQLAGLQSMLEADGLRLRWGNDEHTQGELPDAAALAALDDWTRDHQHGDFLHFDVLPVALRGHPGLCRHGAGVLSMSISPQCELLAVRKEQVQKITWAGKQPEPGDTAQTLTPRSSFEAWSQSVRYRAKRWGEATLEIAQELREALAEYRQAARHKELAYLDPLTGLANRYAFEQAMADRIDHCRRTGERFALHMLDLDEFKPINDTYGHGAGDELLKIIAERMKRLARREDLVARLGGDEFAIIEWHVAGDDDASAQAQRMVAAIEQPVLFGEYRLQVSASMGTAIFPTHAQHASGLSEYADKVLYLAKDEQRRRA
ncbi:GGDEF domain-containing protein [Salinisphaera sp. T5B8]|uniref:sensor domain-containing diguanylate cyclase n=1 Tax=Salinisphaera sp. T5B8 TaxID=1304154 RepID=UPI003341B789